MQSESYHVYFPVPDGVHKQVLRMRDSLGGRPLTHSHVTVMSLYSTRSSGDISDLLFGLVPSPVALRAQGLCTFDSGWRVVEYAGGSPRRPASALGLHLRVARLLEPFVSEPLTLEPQSVEGYEQWQRFGSSHYGEHYVPHLTLGDGGGLVRDFVLGDFSFVASKLVLAQRFENKFYRSVAEVPLV